MTCPSGNELQQLLDEPDSEAGRAVEQHVAECSTCRERLLTLAPTGDTTPDLAPAVEVAILAPGTSIGRYRLLQLLGKGGMGVVYAAHDPELDRTVAVKVLRADRADDSATLRARLQREAQALARLSHPNVVAVYDVGTCAAGVFIAMELIEGETLREWLKRPRAVGAIVDVFAQAGGGLAAAHRAGLVHRDFKPENVLIGKDGRVCVTDFGLARVVGSVVGGERGSGDSPLERSITQTGAVLGTPSYMAPEQLGDGVVDVRTDVFSFCVTLHEALAGVRPFVGRTRQQLMAAMVSGQVQPGRIAAAPAPVRRIARRGLAANRDERPQSMEPLLAALRPNRRARTVGLAAAGLVLALGGGGFFVFQRAHQCDDARHGFDAVWNAGRRTALERAFAATGLPYAADSSRRVVAALDGYADRWRGMSVQACQAARVHHEQSAELFDLRMECLGQRRDVAGATIDLFTRADKASVERAVTAAQSLEPLDACASTTTLRAVAPLPAEPARRARIAELRRKLADAQSLERIGRYAEGMAAIRPLVQAASDLGYAPLTAESLRLRGLLELSSRDFKAARQTLVDSSAAAVAGHDDRAQVEALLLLVRASGDSFDAGARAAGEHWAQLAAVWVDRVGGGDSLHARLAEAQGTLFITGARYDEAVAAFRRAVALHQKAGDTVGMAATLNNLGVAVVKNNQPEEGRRVLEQSAAVLEQSLGPSHPRTAVPLFVLAELLKNEGPIDVAEAHARRALQIFSSALPPNHPRIVATLDTLGAVLLQDDKVDEALATYRRALAGRRPGDPGQAIDRLGMATALSRQSKLDEALATIEAALAATTEPTHRAAALLGRGDLRLQRHEAAAARDDYAAALAVFDRAQGQEEGSVEALVGVGKAELALHRPRQALPPLERALTLVPKAASLAAARARFALARALAESGDPARAATLAQAAADRLATIGAHGRREADEIRAWQREHSAGRLD